MPRICLLARVAQRGGQGGSQRGNGGDRPAHSRPAAAGPVQQGRCRFGLMGLHVGEMASFRSPYQASGRLDGSYH